ncbi:MAG: cytochrome C oxidase subunit IV family protein [Rudanella sp.]|nr:cytochrome C oxidase subunit IV family protein [Rudanella sp.]
MSDYNHHADHVGTEVAPAQTKRIWQVFLILSAVTTLEFVIAFTIKTGYFKTSLFVGLTIVKAFYIVGEFMHLKHEVKGLIWAILLPTLFVCWLLLAMMLEGGSIFNLR